MLTALNSQVSTKSSLNSLRSDKQKFYNKVEPYYQNNGTKVLKSDSVTQSNKEFQVLWHNLCYTVPVSNTENKLILNNLNGYFVSGEVTAILGPSGAGKSTLLKCICGGLKKGLRGEIRFRTTNRLFIGYVPQDDYLIEELTIIESLILASQLNAINNSQKNSGDHYSVANNLIKRFGLERITETKAKHLSGGQRKRLSIALEVLFKPDVLILDEPTTGLDSPSCSHVISMMRELVSDKHNQVAIVCTVHQPSVAIFNSFNRIYMLSINGQCIYNGSPLNLVNTITKAGLKCPSGNTPIDYLMEVANGDYGENSVEKLAIEAQTHDITQTVTANTYVYASVMKRKLHSFWQQMPLLFKRSQLVLYRDIRMSFLRVFCTIITGVFLTLAYSDKVGTASGCIPRELEVWSTSLVELSSKFEETIALINQNLSLLFLSMMTGLVIGLSPVLLNFPREVQVFRKECENGWYSCKSYYISKTVSDIPLQVILPILFILLVYNFTGQPREWHRIANMITVTILMSLISQSMGEMVSAVWMDKPNISVFLGIMIPIPMTLFGGFLVRTSQMPFYMQPLSWLSFLRFAFEAMVVSIYGYHRCDYQYQMFLASVNATAITKPLWVQHLPLLMQFMDDNSNEESQLSDMDRLYTLFGGNLAIEDNKVQTSTPIIINYFSLNDSHYMRAIILLMIYLIALKFITYFVLLFKINTKK